MRGIVLALTLTALAVVTATAAIALRWPLVSAACVAVAALALPRALWQAATAVAVVRHATLRATSGFGMIPLPVRATSDATRRFSPRPASARQAVQAAVTITLVASIATTGSSLAGSLMGISPCRRWQHVNRRPRPNRCWWLWTSRAMATSSSPTRSTASSAGSIRVPSTVRFSRQTRYVYLSDLKAHDADLAFASPADVAVADNGDLYVADAENHRICRIERVSGKIITIAGYGLGGFDGDFVQATQTALNRPLSVAVARNGDLYIADTLNHRVRVITQATGLIHTIAGDGQPGESGAIGDGGPATAAHLNRPTDVALAPNGDVYIADMGHNRIRVVDARTGVITTVAGGGRPARSRGRRTGCRGHSGWPDQHRARQQGTAGHGIRRGILQRDRARRRFGRQHFHARHTASNRRTVTAGVSRGRLALRCQRGRRRDCRARRERPPVSGRNRRAGAEALVMSLATWTLSYLRPYRARMVGLGIIAVAQIALGLLSPWPLKLVVDNVLGGQPMPAALSSPIRALAGDSSVGVLLVVVAAGLLLQLVGQVVSMTNTQVQVDTGQRMVYSLRATLLAHLQALALRHHLATRTSDSVYRLEADAYCVHDLVMSGLFPLATAVLTLAAMFVVLLNLHVTLALLSLTVVPFLFVSLRYYSRRMIDRAEHVKRLESRLIDRLYEILTSIRVVKSFAREGHELERFSESGVDTMTARLRYTWQESLFTMVVSTITLTGTALVLAVGGSLVLRSELTVGELLVVMAYLAAVYGPLSSIAHTTGLLQNAVASARRVREIFALVPEAHDAPGAVDAPAAASEIRFEHVSFSYDDERLILDDVSFVARRGEMVALVGLTGAGKSTMVSLLPRFFEPTRGRVLMDGVDVRKYRLSSLRERIAIVLQDAILFGGTIADNIRYGRLDASDADVEEAARAAHAHDFVMRLRRGYQTPIAEAGASLSGGERQRLNIARALLKNAPVLILDEPTSSLDALSEEAVFAALRRLKQGRTTIVIAHRLSTIRDANRILVLHEGRIAAQGTHDELLEASELYRRMCARLSVGRSLDEPETVDELLQAR